MGLMIDVMGSTSRDMLAYRQILESPAIESVLLFAHNMPMQDHIGHKNLRGMIDALQTMRPGISIHVDQEGGRHQDHGQKRWGVQRLAGPDFPSTMTFADIATIAIEQGLSSAQEAMAIMAENLLKPLIAYGLTPLGPVLDSHDLDVEIIAGLGRSFGPRMDCQHSWSIEALNTLRFELGKQWMAILKCHGVRVMAKHFPDHGSVCADSHVSSSTYIASMDDLTTQIEFYRECIASGWLDEQSSIMMAHVNYPQERKLKAWSNHDDEEQDVMASASNGWINGVLRDYCQYRGQIISDCLSMQAAQLLLKQDQRNEPVEKRVARLIDRMSFHGKARLSDTLILTHLHLFSGQAPYEPNAHAHLLHNILNTPVQGHCIADRLCHKESYSSD